MLEFKMKIVWNLWWKGLNNSRNINALKVQVYNIKLMRRLNDTSGINFFWYSQLVFTFKYNITNNVLDHLFSCRIYGALEGEGK